VKGFTGLAIPHYGGLSLVGNADRFDRGDAVASFFELLNRSVDARRYRRDEFLGIVFMPSWIREDLCKLLWRLSASCFRV